MIKLLLSIINQTPSLQLSNIRVGIVFVSSHIAKLFTPLGDLNAIGCISTISVLSHRILAMLLLLMALSWFLENLV